MLPDSRDIELEQDQEHWERMDRLSRIIHLIVGCYKVYPKRTRALLFVAVLVVAALLGVIVWSTNNVTAFVLGILVAIFGVLIYIRLPRN